VTVLLLRKNVITTHGVAVAVQLATNEGNLCSGGGAQLSSSPRPEMLTGQ